MAILLRNGNNGQGSATSALFTLPTGVAAGDIVLAVIRVGALSQTLSQTGGTGTWTIFQQGNNTPGGYTYGFMYRTFATGDTAPTFSWTGANAYTYSILALTSDAGGTVLLDSWGTELDTATAVNTVTPNAAISTNGGASVILTCAREATVGTAPISFTYTQPSGWSVSNSVQWTGTTNSRFSAVAYQLGISGTVTPGAETLTDNQSGAYFFSTAHATVLETLNQSLTFAPVRRRVGLPPRKMLFQGRAFTPVRAQLNPPFPNIEVRGLRRFLNPRKPPRVATPVRAQLNPPIPTTETRGLRRFLSPARRARAAQVVPAQVATQPLVYPVSFARVRRLGAVLRSSGVSAPVPTSDVPLAPPVPRRRPVLRGRRPSSAVPGAPLTAQDQLPGPMTRRRLWIKSARRTAGPPPVQRGAIAQYDASAITGLSNGANVASWPDVSGNGNDLTQGTAGLQPTYLAVSSPTGLPGIQFSASSTTVGKWLGGSVLPASGGYTLFAVAKTNTIRQATTIIDNGNVNGYGFKLSNVATPLRELLLRSVLDCTDGTATNALEVWEADGPAGGVSGTHSFRVNNGTATTNVQTMLAPTTQFTMGAFEDRTTQFWDGVIHEVIVYDRQLSTVEQTQVYNYLNAKWLTTSLVPSFVRRRTAALLLKSSASFGPPPVQASPIVNPAISQISTGRVRQFATKMRIGRKSEPITSNPIVPSSAFVSRVGATLYRYNQPFTFGVGINLYYAACRTPLVGANRALGANDGKLATALTTLDVESGGHCKVFRFWAYQNLAVTGGVRDWAAIDHVFSVANALGFLTIPVLADEWGDVGDGGATKLATWFTNDYANVIGPNDIVPYKTWVSEFANRYKNETSILMIEFGNELSPYVDASFTLLSDAAGLIVNETWAKDVADTIRAQDPNHLLCNGLNYNNSGTKNFTTNYEDIIAYDGTDFFSYHDYSGDTGNTGAVADTTDLTNLRLKSVVANKPFIVGEIGVHITAGASRPTDYDLKLTHYAIIPGGHSTSSYVGGLPWVWNDTVDYLGSNSVIDSLYDIRPDVDSASVAILAAHGSPVPTAPLISWVIGRLRTVGRLKPRARVSNSTPAQQTVAPNPRVTATVFGRLRTVGRRQPRAKVNNPTPAQQAAAPNPSITSTVFGRLRTVGRRQPRAKVNNPTPAQQAATPNPSITATVFGRLRIVGRLQPRAKAVKPVPAQPHVTQTVFGRLRTAGRLQPRAKVNNPTPAQQAATPNPSITATVFGRLRAIGRIRPSARVSNPVPAQQSATPNPRITATVFGRLRTVGRLQPRAKAVKPVPAQAAIPLTAFGRLRTIGRTNRIPRVSKPIPSQVNPTYPVRPSVGGLSGLRRVWLKIRRKNAYPVPPQVTTLSGPLTITDSSGGVEADRGSGTVTGGTYGSSSNVAPIYDADSDSL